MIHTFSGMEDDGVEIVYRFPYSRAAVELTSDATGIGGTVETFAVRLLWNRGKTVRTLLATTPLRPIAEVTLGGQTFPLFPSVHARKGRERMALAGRRKTARNARHALRFNATVQGREDRLIWTWRLGATAAALADPRPEDAPADSLVLHLPFAGPVRVVTLDDHPDGAAIWMNDLVVTVVGKPTPEGRQPRLETAPGGLSLRVDDADFSGSGQSVCVETWVCAARTETEVREALVRHLAESATASQVTTETAPFLEHLAESAGNLLLNRFRTEKLGVDRLAFTLRPGVAGIGEGVDAASTACALLGRFHLTGDDAYRRRARLLSYAVPGFQINDEDGAHWGAIWDCHHKGRGHADNNEESTLSTRTTARAAAGLHVLNAHFGVDLLDRAALTAAQWLVLKRDRDGFLVGEHFLQSGQPVPDGSPWVVGETLVPMVATFRATQNETFLKAALHSIKGIRERLDEGTLRATDAPTEYLCAAIEGILQVSREYENENLIALARRLADVVRARLRPDGAVADLGGEATCASTLAAVRAALAMARVETDPQWLRLALRALRRARLWAQEDPHAVSIADMAGLCALPSALLLCVAAHIQEGTANRDNLTLSRGWQTFAPDPSTREYIQVSGPNGEPVDAISLVCSTTLQVIVAVIAPPNVREVHLLKNRRRPFLRHLLTGNCGPNAPLVPLGDGTEANIGIFLADT